MNNEKLTEEDYAFIDENTQKIGAWPIIFMITVKKYLSKKNAEIEQLNKRIEELEQYE